MLGGYARGGTEVWAASTAASGPRISRRALALTVSVCAALGVGLALSSGASTEIVGGVVGPHLLSPALLDDVRRSLQVATGAFFLGAGLLHLAVARVTGTRSHAHVGAALVAFGFLAPWMAGFGHILHVNEAQATLTPVTTSALVALTLALGATGLGTLQGLESLEERQASSRPTVVSAGALLVTLLLAPVLLHRALTQSLDLPSDWHVGLEIVVAAGWFSAAAHTGRLRRRGEIPVVAASSPVLVSMGIVWLFRAAAAVELQPWSLAAAILLGAIGLVVLWGATLAFVDSAEEGLDRRTSVEESLETVAQAFTRLDRQRQSLAHDARNVVLALEAASRTLVDHGDDLDPQLRHRIRAAIAQEVTNLGHLLTTPPAADAAVFDAGEVISSVVALEALRGLEIETDMASVAVVGSPEDFARAMRNLLVNVREHAPGSRVHIRVRETTSHARVVVEDDGPGIPAPMRQAVFGRGVSGVHSSGAGLGLHLSRALMQQQGGTMELADRAGRGARFVLTLPLAGPSSACRLPQQRDSGATDSDSEAACA